jgi:hypothetical protein
MYFSEHFTNNSILKHSILLRNNVSHFTEPETRFLCILLNIYSPYRKIFMKNFVALRDITVIIYRFSCRNTVSQLKDIDTYRFHLCFSP